MKLYLYFVIGLLVLIGMPTVSRTDTTCIVELNSYGTFDTSNFFTAWIKNNGTTVYTSTFMVYPPQRGVTTAVLDPVKCTSSNYLNFDTFASAGNATSLSNYVLSLPVGAVLQGITQDDPSLYLAAAAATLQNVLNVHVSSLYFRGKFAFVAQIGNMGTTVSSVQPSGGNNLNLVAIVSVASSGGTSLITRYCADNCATCAHAGQNKCDQCYSGPYILNQLATSPQTFCTACSETYTWTLFSHTQQVGLLIVQLYNNVIFNETTCQLSCADNYNCYGVSFDLVTNYCYFSYVSNQQTNQSTTFDYWIINRNYECIATVVPVFSTPSSGTTAAVISSTVISATNVSLIVGICVGIGVPVFALIITLLICLFCVTCPFYMKRHPASVAKKPTLVQSVSRVDDTTANEGNGYNTLSVDTRMAANNYTKMKSVVPPTDRASPTAPPLPDRQLSKTAPIAEENAPYSDSDSRRGTVSNVDKLILQGRDRLQDAKVPAVYLELQYGDIMPKVPAVYLELLDGDIIPKVPAVHLELQDGDIIPKVPAIYLELHENAIDDVVGTDAAGTDAASEMWRRLSDSS